MSLVAYALTTVARFKAYAGVTTSDDDTVIENIINGVTEYIEKSRINRRLKETAYTGELYDGNSSHELQLEQFPVSQSASFTLYERDTTLNQDSWDTLDSDDYFIDYEAGIIRANFKFVNGVYNYKVDYTAGFGFDNAGSDTLESVGLGDLEVAVWELCKAFYKKRKSDPSIKQLRLGDRSIVYSQILQERPMIADVIDSYARFDL